MPFSSKDRNQISQQLASDTFDVLVVGGGITGAGIALDAASRGLSVALVEKNDFASGTSSRSTKLIHGGLRYLKQFEVKLVREVGLERAVVYRNAPHVVIPEKMLLPIVKGGSLGKKSSSLGLYVYDRLARVRRKERRKMLSKRETLMREPMLREDVLVGGGYYTEYRTDDARLVIEALKAAVERGAGCLNYMTLLECTHDDGRVSGGQVRDELNGETLKIRAKTVINACGPWVDELRKKEGSLEGKHLLQTKGIHLVVSQSRLPLQQSVYFDVPTDNRMIFAIPRGKVVYLGTTDTVYKDDMDHPLTSAEDAAYILKAVNFMFPSAELTVDDVESSWAGLRPLIHEEGKSPSEVSRKDEIFIAPSQLISIAGGKLTGYRKMAERAVDEAMEQLKDLEGRPFVKCRTKTIELAGGQLNGNSGVLDFIEYLVVQFPEVPADAIRDLVYRYGDHADEILEQYDKGERKDLLLDELDYAIREEQVSSLSDFLIRRTGRLFFERPSLASVYRKLHEYISDQLGHSQELSDRLLEAFEREYEAVVAFKSAKPSQSESTIVS